jgi:phosphonate transport system substrate-binding protein
LVTQRKGIFQPAVRHALLRILLAAWILLLNACGTEQAPPYLDLSLPASLEELAAAAQPTETHQTFQFGFDLRHGPKEDARQYLPLLDYLARTTGHQFNLRFTANADQLLTELARGELQFAAIGAGSYLTASRQVPIVPLVRGVNAAGEAGYRAVMVVAADSELQQMQDLKGRRLAFGSATSTQGHWIPRIMLHQAGLKLQDLGGYFFSGSHRNCADAVISGKADACGLQDTLAQRFIEAALVKQLAVSDLYPSSGIFAHTQVPLEIRAAARQALIDFDPQKNHPVHLYNWEATEMAGGFAAVSIEDYTNLRTWAERLELLSTRNNLDKLP